MTENERLYEFLKEAADRGLITTSFDTSEQDNRTINRGASLGFLKPHPTQNGTYHLDDKGWKVVDANGDFSVVEEQPTSLNVTATNAIVGDVSGTVHQSSVSERTIIENNTPKTKPSRTQTIIAVLAVIIAIIGIGVMIWLDYN
ncbi:hypothetical protein [Shewanella sp.]|uniref:hypothetical protein n=1 Tax=Shewanella sp. TaxID=50422 RepID=UPI004053F548